MLHLSGLCYALWLAPIYTGDVVSWLVTEYHCPLAISKLYCSENKKSHGLVIEVVVVVIVKDKVVKLVVIAGKKLHKESMNGWINGH